MNFDLYKATIWLVLSGSRAYGFASETSDWDYRGIAVPPLPAYIGLESRFEQAVDVKTKHVWKHYPEGMVQPEADMQVMELSKFCRLALDSNPSIIEILFSSDESIIFQHPIMKELIDNREMFLSKMVKARFCGYATSQINRVKRHKRWLDNPITKKPQREDFGLPKEDVKFADQIGAAESLIQKEINTFLIDQEDLSETTKIELKTRMGRMMRTIWAGLTMDSYPVGVNQKYNSTDEALREAVLSQQGFSENFLEILKKEKQYRSKKQEWDQYQEWLKDRNPERAEMERKFGYDLKHVTHCYRLLRMAREILETGKVNVKRPDAEELKAMRTGVCVPTYEKICEFAEKEDVELNEVMKNSKLPLEPNSKKAHEIVCEMILKFNCNYLKEKIL